MTEEQAKEICTLYGLDVAKVGKAFAAVAHVYAEPVRAALEATAKDLKTHVKDLGSLKKLAAFLNSDKFGADPSARSACLIGVNQVFQTSWVEIDAKYETLGLPDVVAEMLNTAKQWAPSILAYVNDPAREKRLHVMLLGREAIGKAGTPKMEIYELIHYFHDKKISFDLLALSASNDFGQRLKNINRYRLAAPALNAFGGISSWGPGDAEDKTAATNLRNHMLKHVLDDDQQGKKEALDWPGEPALWWNLLGIKLTFADVKKHLPVISNQVAHLFGVSPGDEAKLPNGKVREFLNVARPPSMTVQFEDHMCKGYLKAYGDFALATAMKFSRGMVGCEKKFGHTVGIYLGVDSNNVFLFGRLQDAGAKIELSSCYITEGLDKKFSSAEQLWALSAK